MSTLSVIIPSREQAIQARLLMGSIGSVQAQNARGRLQIEVLVGIDPEAAPPALDAFDFPVQFVNASARSGAAAVNAAAASAAGDYVAILEDDDVWDPDHLDVSLRALEHGAFVSGTQLEVDNEGTVVRINDFPTPTGWVMPRSTWEQVGPFDTDYRLHHDNEWLGRLAEQGVARAHLIESTAPLSVDVARQVRPWLANVIDFGGGNVRLVRHDSPVPLVRRLVHTDSLMHRIATDEGAKALSGADYDRLFQRYGRIPW
ncbi:MAG: glycosyltransferase family 2 protein [Mycobacterium sp.]